MSAGQLGFWAGTAAPPPVIRDATSTFLKNLTLPVHRWFRFSAGFSAQWVRDLINLQNVNQTTNVLDPFAGSGTTVLEGEFSNVVAVGVEAHPFVARIARTKLLWRSRPRAFKDRALLTLKQASDGKPDTSDYPSLIHKCFPLDALNRLDTLRRAWLQTADASSASELVWLALASILRECSPVGTAQWQYILPRKVKSKVLDPYDAFERKVHLMLSDMEQWQAVVRGPKASIHWADSRDGIPVPNGWANLVVTSPPYANNYDYADATRLEMSFFQEIQGWGDLQAAVRKYLVRSCTQHVADLNGKTWEILEDPILEPIRKEAVETCRRLEREKEKHGGKKPYHTMIAGYFCDLARVWVNLRRATSKGCLVCFVVGDSAPYGVHVPVERWLGELAISAGFASFEFEKIRDRNVKWKNRKHRVPLQEGRLWVKG